MHNQAMILFQQYMLVGGMPMPVVAFIDNNKGYILMCLSSEGITMSLTFSLIDIRDPVSK